MKAVIVCESMFGNTEVLAEMVREGLVRTGFDADHVEVGRELSDPRDLSAYDLLVVAAPTHALSLSRPESRAEAVSKGADPRREHVGVREWLASITGPLPDPAPLVAVFDTKVEKARHWPGSAGRRAARTLRKDGFEVLDCVSFYVEGVTGPLSPGEVERARDWGGRLAELARAVRPENGAAHLG